MAALLSVPANRHPELIPRELISVPTAGVISATGVADEVVTTPTLPAAILAFSKRDLCSSGFYCAWFSEPAISLPLSVVLPDGLSGPRS